MRSYYENVKNEVMGSRDNGTVWIENSDRNERSVVGFVQLFCDGTVTKLNSSVLVPYPVHSILINTSARRRKMWIGNGHTLARFLLAGFTQEQLEGEESAEDETLWVYGFTSPMVVLSESRV